MGKRQEKPHKAENGREWRTHLEALDVDLERLDRLVASAVIDSNADRRSLLAADARLLELLEREPAPVLDLKQRTKERKGKKRAGKRVRRPMP